MNIITCTMLCIWISICTPILKTGSCHDGIMNHGETDVDCGGNLCPSCGVGDVSTIAVALL